MAAGVLPQSEPPYYTVLDSSGYAANMKGPADTTWWQSPAQCQTHQKHCAISTSGHQVMVAVAAVRGAERSPTCPEKKRISGRPAPKYTKVGERLRHVIPGHVACSVACGGKACKYENPARWSEQEQAIRGVYSSWVTDSILAMARPSTELLEKYSIIDQFQTHGIKTVINLQRPGEHASCGNPLEQESGFTYLPEAFMEAGIYFYNFGWKDYGVASLTTILDMVKVMTFALQEGKVAIHCHAGLGRTGVLIACYLVFATRMSADQAIIFVRAKRPNSIQTRGQLLCVREFTQFLIPLRNIFACCDPKAHAVTLAQYLIRQRHLLHGYEGRLLKHVPKIIHLVCRLLLDLAENRPVAREEAPEGASLCAEIEKTVSEVVTMQLDEALLRADSTTCDSCTPSVTSFETQDSEVVLPNRQELDPLWKRRNAECLQPLTCLKKQLSYSDSDLKRAEWLLEQVGTPWTVPAQALPCQLSGHQTPLSHCHTPQSPHVDLGKETLCRNAFSFWNQTKYGGLVRLKDDGSPVSTKNISKEVHRSRTFSSGVSGPCNPGEPASPDFANLHKEQNCPHHQVHPCQCDTHGGAQCAVSEDGDPHHNPGDYRPGSKARFSVRPETSRSRDLSEVTAHTGLLSELSVEARRILAAKALANLNEFAEKEEVKKKVEMWQKELNSQDGAWERIRGERDPFTLCSLMWSWVEQLKEPVITREDVDMLADSTDTAKALFLLEKGQHQTILCVLHCLVSLHTLPEKLEEAVLDHAVRAFTKVDFDSENGPMVYNTLKKIFKCTLEERRKLGKGGSQPGALLS